MTEQAIVPTWIHASLVHALAYRVILALAFHPRLVIDVLAAHSQSIGGDNLQFLA